jgi:ribonuclease HI
MMMRMYTDGSSVNNGRKNSKGGYSAVYPAHLDQSFGRTLPDGSQTNQTAEMTAIYQGLVRLREFTDVSAIVLRIGTDSEYSINCLTKWVVGWRKRNWMTADGKPVVHRDLIEKILKELETFGGHQFVHIRSHTGAPDEDSKWNDVADQLARKAVDDQKDIAYADLQIKQIRPDDTSKDAVEGIPLALMGPPITDDALFDALRANPGAIKTDFLKSALISAFKKTLNAKAYDLEKTKIHTKIAYRLVEKSHLTIVRSEE